MFIQRIVGLLLAGVIAVNGAPATGTAVEPALEVVSPAVSQQEHPTLAASRARLAAHDRATRSELRETPRKVKAVRKAPTASASKPVTASKQVVVHHPNKNKKKIHVSSSGNRALGKRLASSRGWGSGSQWVCLERLWTEESGWSTTSDNPSSDAYGIPQALPGSKMGPGWRTDATVQIKWGLRYIAHRYGDPCSALGAKHSKGWY